MEDLLFFIGNLGRFLCVDCVAVECVAELSGTEPLRRRSARTAGVAQEPTRKALRWRRSHRSNKHRDICAGVAHPHWGVGACCARCPFPSRPVPSRRHPGAHNCSHGLAFYGDRRWNHYYIHVGCCNILLRERCLTANGFTYKDAEELAEATINPLHRQHQPPPMESTVNPGWTQLHRSAITCESFL
jgi:hypothetical protein